MTKGCIWEGFRKDKGSAFKRGDQAGKPPRKCHRCKVCSGGVTSGDDVVDDHEVEVMMLPRMAIIIIITITLAISCDLWSAFGAFWTGTFSIALSWTLLDLLHHHHHHLITTAHFHNHHQSSSLLINIITNHHYHHQSSSLVIITIANHHHHQSSSSPITIIANLFRPTLALQFWRSTGATGVSMGTGSGSMGGLTMSPFSISL